MNEIIDIQARQLLEYNTKGNEKIFEHLLKTALYENWMQTNDENDSQNIWRGQRIDSEALKFIKSGGLE